MESERGAKETISSASPNVDRQLEENQSVKDIPDEDHPLACSMGPDILTPTPITTKEIAQAPRAVTFQVKDFESVDDPFDDLELKVLDDMAELKSVLAVAQQNTSPLLDNSHADARSPCSQFTTAVAADPETDLELAKANQMAPISQPTVPTGVSHPMVQSRDRLPLVHHTAPPGSQIHHTSVTNDRNIPSENCDVAPVSAPVPKRRPINLDDYDISLPNTDHLNMSMAPPNVRAVNGSVTEPKAARRSLGNVTTTDMRQFLTGPTVNSLRSSDCQEYPGCNGVNSKGFHTPDYIPSNSSVIHDSSKPRATTDPMTSSMNASGSAPDQVTFDSYRYAGHKLRSARSASDLRKLGKEMDESAIRLSQSPPPRTPNVQVSSSLGQN